MAAQWSIPVVNHTWLEDCFVNWRNLSVGHEKYVRFSTTCDYSGFLGDKGIGRRVILNDAEQDAPTPDVVGPTGSMVEVEEAIAVDDNDTGTNGDSPIKDDAEVEDVEIGANDAQDMGTDVETSASPKRRRTASPSPTPRKRQKSGDAKPNITEEAGSRRSAPNRRPTYSHVEAVILPRSGRDSSTSAQVKKPASHKLKASESPVVSKKSSPIKVKTPTRKSVTSVEEEEEEEIASTKRVLGKRVQRRERNETDSEDEQSESEKPTPGPSKPKPTQMKGTQRPRQDSSSPPAHVGNVPVRGRRSAARKADEKLKDIMPDVINFQKQMKRGAVVGEWEKAEKEQEKSDKKKDKNKDNEKEKSKENAREKVKETGKRRRSDIGYD